MLAHKPFKGCEFNVVSTSGLVSYCNWTNVFKAILLWIQNFKIRWMESVKEEKLMCTCNET